MFSPLTTTKSASWRSRSAGSSVSSVRRPSPPTTSPTNRIADRGRGLMLMLSGASVTAQLACGAGSGSRDQRARAGPATRRVRARRRRAAVRTRRAGGGEPPSAESRRPPAARRRRSSSRAGSSSSLLPLGAARAVGAGARRRDGAADPDRREHRGADPQPARSALLERADAARARDPRSSTSALSRCSPGSASCSPTRSATRSTRFEHNVPQIVARPTTTWTTSRRWLNQPRHQRPHRAAGPDRAQTLQKNVAQALGRRSSRSRAIC